MDFKTYLSVGKKLYQTRLRSFQIIDFFADDEFIVRILKDGVA